MNLLRYKNSAFISLILMLSACGANEKLDVMFECASPTGAKIATFYRISHGSNAINQEMHISIRYADSTFSDVMPSFSFKHGYDAMIDWQSDHKMTITYPIDSELTHQETVIFGSNTTFSSSDTIKIHYQQKPSTHGYFVIAQRCFNLSQPPAKD